MRKLFFALALTSVAALLYTALWVGLALNLRKQGDIVLGNLQAKGVGVERRLFSLSGFPGTPTLSLAGSLTFSETRVDIPVLTVRSFLIPGLPFTAEIAQPVRIRTARAQPSLLSLAESVTRGRVTTVLPARWPRDPYEDTLRAWRDAGGAVEIREVHAELEGGAIVSGKGRFNLDESLNPQGALDLMLTDPHALSTLLVRAGALKPEHAPIAGAVIGAMARPDPLTNRPTLAIDLTLANRVLTLGPLKIGQLPRAAWPQRPPPSDRYNSPDPPR